MQLLVLTLFTAVFALDFLAFQQLVSAKITLIAEFLSLCATLAFVAYLSRDRSLALSFKYLVFFVLLVIHLVNGVIISATPTGAIVSGIRGYFKYAPFFLLPLVYHFSARQVSVQVKFLLFICLLQLPVALFQRLVLYRGELTGDNIRGLMETSSYLSIFLICAIAVTMAFYLKRLISLRAFLILLLLLFIPTAINETKGTLILLPIALFVPLLFSKRDQAQRKQTWALLAISGVLFGGYVLAYNTFYGHRYAAEEGAQGGVLGFFTNPHFVIRYLAPRTSGKVTREDGLGPVGRIDRLVLAAGYLSQDPIQLLVGLGIGRVTESPIDALSPDMEVLSDEVSAWSGDPVGWQSEAYGGAGFVRVLWELGLLGVLLLYVFMYLVFRDARALSARNDMDGAIGLGWCAVVPIIAISYFYKDILTINGLMYPFWYLTGYVVAQRFRHGFQVRSIRTDSTIRRRTHWSPAPAQGNTGFRSLAPRLGNPRP